MKTFEEMLGEAAGVEGGVTTLDSVRESVGVAARGVAEAPCFISEASREAPCESLLESLLESVGASVGDARSGGANGANAPVVAVPLNATVGATAGVAKRVSKRASRNSKRAKALVLRAEDVTTEARRRSLGAINVVASIMADARNPVGIRLRAAQELLNRAWGAAPQEVPKAPALTPDEASFGIAKLRAELVRNKKKARASWPLWVRVASDYLSEGKTTAALLVTLTENPKAAAASDGSLEALQESVGESVGESVK